MVPNEGIKPSKQASHKVKEERGLVVTCCSSSKGEWSMPPSQKIRLGLLHVHTAFGDCLGYFFCCGDQYLTKVTKAGFVSAHSFGVRPIMTGRHGGRSLRQLVTLQPQSEMNADTFTSLQSRTAVHRMIGDTHF